MPWAGCRRRWDPVGERSVSRVSFLAAPVAVVAERLEGVLVLRVESDAFAVEPHSAFVAADPVDGGAGRVFAAFVGSALVAAAGAGGGHFSSGRAANPFWKNFRRLREKSCHYLTVFSLSALHQLDQLFENMAYFPHNMTYFLPGPETNPI